MKILYDYQIFGSQKYGGVSRYFYEIANRISGFGGHEVEVLAPLYINEYFGREAGGLKPRGFKIASAVGTGKIRHLINQTASKLLAIRERNVDIVHETYYSRTDSSPKSRRRILTVFDMIHEKFPGQFRQPGHTADNKLVALRRADHVICISERTRNDVLSLTDIREKRISVVHLGHWNMRRTDVEQTGRIVERPYLLYVGLRSGYKNFRGFLSAFARSHHLRSTFQIVCFGGPSLSTEELALLASLGLRPDQVVHIGGDDSLLARLYSGAIALVYPSMYEGFGIPPLEAMALGCPVICSNASSLPEVVGDAAELFDPCSEHDMMLAVERVALSPERANFLSLKGQARSKLFSWERCARETLQVYEQSLDS